MTAQTAAVPFSQASRIQIELLRRLGRVWAIIIGCAGGALAVELIQVRLAATGASLGSVHGIRFMIVAMLALIWGASIWRGEAPKSRQYFLSHPVDATIHELSRVAAGAAWLAVAVAASIVVAVAGALLRRDASAFDGGIVPWINLFTSGLLIYLAVSAIATVTSRVAEVIIVGYLSLVMLIPLLAMTGIGERVGKLFNTMMLGTYGLRAAVQPPAPGALSKWIVALVIWYGVAACMMAAALWWRRGRLASR